MGVELEAGICDESPSEQAIAEDQISPTPTEHLRSKFHFTNIRLETFRGVVKLTNGFNEIGTDSNICAVERAPRGCVSPTPKDLGYETFLRSRCRANHTYIG